MDDNRRTTSTRANRPAPTRRSAAGVRRAAPTSGGSSATRKTASSPQPSARPSARAAATTQKSNGKIFIILGVLVVALAIFGLVRACSSDGASSPVKKDATVSFVAVGDNLPDEILGEYAYEQGGDHYDYTPIYEFMKPHIQAADLAYVKEEVHLDSNLGVHGYPSFNAAEELADDLISVGFDIVGSASNHIYDWGYFGACANNRKVWNTKDVVFAGTNLNAEEANTIATFERNGITFAFLDYTYGVNGFSQDELDWWEINFISEDRITKDVTRAHEMAEVVIVAMHWGTENNTGIDEDQEYYAQLLANLNVDLVLGSHPHVIGPVAWLEGTDGHKTLCAYSLGNFLSRHITPHAINELEGMINLDFVRKDGVVTIENAVWTPLINHTDLGNYYFRVFPITDYTNEIAADGEYMMDLDDAVGWVRETTHEIVGDAIPINYGITEEEKQAKQ